MKITYELNSKDYEDDYNEFLHDKECLELAQINHQLINTLDDEVFRPFFKYGYQTGKLHSSYLKVKDNDDVIEFMEELRDWMNTLINSRKY